MCPHFREDGKEIREGHVACSRSLSWSLAEEEELKQGP